MAEMEAAGQAFCALGWEEARSRHPETPEEFLASYCFSSMYFTVLMHHGYGVDKTRTPLHWAEEIDGVGLDWPLGATLRATCAAVPDRVPEAEAVVGGAVQRRGCGGASTEAGAAAEEERMMRSGSLPQLASA